MVDSMPPEVSSQKGGIVSYSWSSHLFRGRRHVQSGGQLSDTLMWSWRATFADVSSSSRVEPVIAKYYSDPRSVSMYKLPVSSRAGIVDSSNYTLLLLPLGFRHRSFDLTSWWDSWCHCSWLFFCTHPTTNQLNQTCAYGRRAFSVAGPMAWNSLPDFIRDPTSSKDCFRHRLKTYLFAQYYCIQRIRGS